MRDATGPAETGGMDSVRIYDIMACNVYWDFDGSDLPREQHKFLVSFHPTDTPTPELVESIVATGPGGYRVEFANEPFTQRNLNGHIHDAALGFHWYMVNLPTGYLPEGEYTIEVTAKDGTVGSRSRVQRQESTDRIVPAYREHRARLLDSFTPSRTAEPAGPVERIGWRTLAGLGGPDAYYVFRLAEGGTLREFDTQRLVWWDNIYLDAVRSGEPTTGLNRGEVIPPVALEPGKSYGYFVEITDGNVQRDADLCVFQPHQFFTVPA
ncbi:hypothetical protein FHX81_7573 [Saccharothrix saharensis]|uniref:Uncharacterized protein n=1 Tax=Saccharothrix saharensis TaxID=571190 RepID=A0A543JQK1_9PSEU|nr:hypothetical protein [Saccharothrix saharensis]TQM85103.1 hypothetical protein FHX81_7573 [Saccharothrix saharensis]